MSPLPTQIMVIGIPDVTLAYTDYGISISNVTLAYIDFVNQHP